MVVPWSRTILAILLVAAMALVACGTQQSSSSRQPTQSSAEQSGQSEPENSWNLDLKSAEEVMNYVKNMDPEERASVLREGAKKNGGTINLYITWSEKDQQQLHESFKKAFPDLKLVVWRASGDEVYSRVVNEFRGNSHRVDVIEDTILYPYDFQKEGIIVPYTAPNVHDYPKGLYDPAGYWQGIYALPICLAWNTNRIAAEDTPNRWEDLADPKYSGQFSLDVQEQLMLFYLRKRFGEVEGTELARKIAANNPRLIRNRANQMGLLAAGEFDMTAAMYEQYAIQEMEKGAPVDFKYLEGPVLVNMGVGMLAKHAPNPYGAVLLLDWMTSPDTQQFIADIGRIAALPGVTYANERQGVVLQERELFELNTDEYGPVNEQTLIDYRNIFGITQ